MIKNNKGITPVIAVALLIVVSVVTVIAFQGWFQTYSSDLFVQTEKGSSSTSNTNIETLVGDQLYFKNTQDNNLSIKQIKIGNKECNISINLTNGVHNISLGNCVKNLTSQVNDITVITDKQIYTKKHLFKDVKEVFSNQNLGNSCSNPFICFINPTPENNLVSTDTDYLINVSVKIQDIYNLTFDWNGSKENLTAIGTFIKVFNGTEDDYPYNLIKTSDDYLILSGYLQSYGSANHQYFLSKFDFEGNLIWTSILSGSDKDYSADVFEFSNGDLVVTGYTNSWGGSDNDLLVSRFDNDGNEIWSSYFGGTSHDLGWSLVEASDGNIIVGGNTVSYSPNSYDDFILSKYNFSTGEEIWSSRIGTTNDEAFSEIIRTQDDGYIMIGSSRGFGTTYHSCLIAKFDNNGNEIWSTYLREGYSESCKSVIELDDGNLIADGYTYNLDGENTNYELLLVKFNGTNGEEIWTKYLDLDEVQPGAGTTIKRFRNNSFVVAGMVNQANYKTLVSRFDLDGNEIWTTIMDGSGGNEYSRSIEVTNESIFVTSTSKILGGTDSDIVLYKLNKDGLIDNYANILRPDISTVSVSIDSVDTGLSSAFVTADSVSIDASSSFINVENQMIINNEVDIKGIYPNQYFEINKTGLSIGKYNYSAKVCNLTNCYEENRSLTIN